MAAWSTAKVPAQQGRQLWRGGTIMMPTCARQRAGVHTITGTMQVASPLSTSTLPPLALCLTMLFSTVPSASIRKQLTKGKTLGEQC